MAEDFIDNAIDFWNLIYKEKEIDIKFEKKDGTTRFMKATLDFMKIPAEQVPKQQINVPKIINLARKNKVIHVFDLEKQAWRSVNLTSVEYVKVKNKVYKVKM